MTYAGINKLFTDEVARYIAMGYAINCGTMNGSQGEIAKVDLTNGKEIIRVLLETHSVAWKDYIEVKVGRCKSKNAKPNAGRTSWTIWNDELEIISSSIYWKTSNWGNPRNEWFTTEEEVDANNKKRMARAKAGNGEWESSGNKIYTSDEVKRIVLPFVRRQKGFKTAKLSDIESVRKGVSDNHVSYYVVAKRKQLFLSCKMDKRA